MSRASALFQEAKNNHSRRAFLELKELANANPTDSEPLTLQGLCYYSGYGVSRKAHKAVEPWSKAADMGSDEAMCRLGMFYLNEKPYQDIALAAHWLLEAAKRNTDSMHGSRRAIRQLELLAKRTPPHDVVLTSLADCYAFAYSVEQNLEKAAILYNKAALAGNDVAMCSLGMAYRFGRGVPEDLQLAERWYQEATSRNTCHPKGSLRAAKELRDLAVPLANHLFELLVENGCSARQLPELLRKLENQHRVVLQNDIRTLKLRRELMRVDSVVNRTELANVDELILIMQTAVNYPCCLNDWVNLQSRSKEFTTKLERWTHDNLVEARHFAVYMDRIRQINQYIDKIKDTLDDIQKDIDQEQWLVKAIFYGDYKPGLPSGIKLIKNILQSMSHTQSYESIFSAYTGIVDILAAKAANTSSGRHPMTTGYYDKWRQALLNIRFNHEHKSVLNNSLRFLV